MMWMTQEQQGDNIYGNMGMTWGGYRRLGDDTGMTGMTWEQQGWHWDDMGMMEMTQGRHVNPDVVSNAVPESFPFCPRRPHCIYDIGNYNSST